jgi:hypothetical protein
MATQDKSSVEVRAVDSSPSKQSGVTPDSAQQDNSAPDIPQPGSVTATGIQPHCHGAAGGNPCEPN